MIVLGIETATPVCSVGLTDGEKVLARTSEEAGRRHSIVLVDMVERTLKEAGVSRHQLEGIAVSAGPGSFTGLRIGMGLAKGICMSLDIPIAPVSTLSALVVHSGSAASVVCGCLDARHEELYSGIYRTDGAKPETLHPDASRGAKDLISLLSPDAVVIGYEITDYVEVFSNAGFDVIPDVSPDGGAVAILGERQLVDGDRVALDLAEPNYCKKSQAERLRAQGTS
jgi:tRNA threonylcarbamoyladenosine biosynthesis protein TsaB